MALINCPECGRENVSDSAEMCPGCGFGIKSHFLTLDQSKSTEIESKSEETILKEHTEIIEEENPPIQNEYSELISACKNELEIDELTSRCIETLKEDNIKSPEEPKFPLKGILVFSTLWFLFLWTSIKFYAEWWFPVFFWPVVIILILSTYIALYTVCSSYSDYKLASADFEAYKNLRKQCAKKALEERLEATRQKNNQETIRLQNIPLCPVCHSHNVERISTTSRVVSVATVGLASGKIGKQYRCKNCKHLW